IRPHGLAVPGGFTQRVSWFDSQLNEPCEWVAQGNQTAGCLPPVLHQLIIGSGPTPYYADASCTERIGRVPVCGNSVPAYLREDDYSTCQTSRHVFPVGAAFTSTTAYANLGSCAPFSISGQDYYRLGAEVALGMFKTGNIVVR